MDPSSPRCVIYDPSTTLIQPAEHQNQREDESGATGATVKKQERKKRPKCRECIGCQPIQKEDCGECVACKDKPKFGGPGRRHVPCLYHQCQQLKYKPKDLSKVPNTGMLTGRCGKCIGCLRNDKKNDCGQCKACKKKAKFGGNGKSYQLCRYRECQKTKYTPKSGAVAGAEPSPSRNNVGEKRKLDSASTAKIPEVSGGSAVKKRKVDSDTVSQSRPLVSILKKKHPTTGEGASVVTKRQKIQPTAEESPEERAPVELQHQSSCATPGTQLDSRASLPNILTFPDKSGESIGIHKRIGTKYKIFGIILLNDSDGRTVDTISTNENGDAEDINIEILKRWVQGAGRQPATWRILIKALKLSGLGALAEEIEDKIKYTYVVD